MLELYSKTDKRLGVHKITDCLNRDFCINISCGRVYRLIKTMNLPKMSTVKPPKSTYSKVFESNCSNLLAQNFDQPAPDMVWVSDFTYIRVANRFYYICAILDIFSRKIIAYKISDKTNTQLALDTLNIALSTRNGISGLMFHSDRGSQFTPKSFRQYLNDLNIVQSFSAKEHPYDNAVMECFFNI